MNEIEIIEHKSVKKDLLTSPLEIRKKYKIFISLILELGGIGGIYNFPGYHLENLSGCWKGFKSVRLNNKWRIIFHVNKLKEIEIITIRRITPHDYREKA